MFIDSVVTMSQEKHLASGERALRAPDRDGEPITSHTDDSDGL